MEKFSLSQTLWTSFIYGNKRDPMYGPSWTFSTLAQIFFFLTVCDIMRKPYEKYYDFKDPLELENESQGAIDQSLEKQKYKKRLAAKEFMEEK